MLYECLTGHRASARRTPRRPGGEPLAPRILLDFGNTTYRIAPAVEDVVRTCLERDPRDRFQSVRDLVLAFSRAITTHKVAIPTPTEADDEPGAAAVERIPGTPPGYRILSQLGTGGFGEVWMAEGPGGHRVALKFVRMKEGIEDCELRALEYFKRIRHPNLMVPFGSWQDGGRLVIGMELAEGTLADRLKAAQEDGLVGIPRGELIESLREAAKGLDFLNDPGHLLEDGRRGRIYHCDVKPQNILMLGGGVKVADFGLSTFADRSLTSYGGGLTVAYAAPEFLSGRSARQSDQYSLAITYCQLRGGRRPFEGETAQIVSGHLTREPDLSMLPKPERPAVRRALSKDPRRRWENCRAFVEALARTSDADPGPDRLRLWAGALRAWAGQFLRTAPGRPPDPGSTTLPYEPANRPEGPSTRTV